MNRVTFDDSFITRVYVNPAKTLEEYTSIWQEETFSLISDWHKSSGTPLDHTIIKQNLNKLKEQTLEDRSKHPVVMLRDKIMSCTSAFQTNVFPRLALLLPPDTFIEATASLVSLIVPGAFCAAGKIIVNLSNPQFLKAGDDLILNIIAHELYHFGFHSHQRHVPIPSEATPKEITKHILWWLQNEGMATYASYSLTDIYPTHGAARDYILLDNPNDVRKNIETVNEILSSTTNISRDEFVKLIWKKGVRERAFYVVGTHMARTIDQEVNREALILLIKKGPLSYIQAYNDASPKKMKLFLPTHV